jgi:uncharacterized protein
MTWITEKLPKMLIYMTNCRMILWPFPVARHKSTFAQKGTTMANSERPRPGTILWHDLTVPNAEPVRDFYAAVVGWRPEPVSMHGHDDFNMMAGDDEEPTAGICHALGEIAGLPPQWLIYTVVEDLGASIEACNEHGGKVIWGPGDDGQGGGFCVVQDPAGAVMALIKTA